MSETCRTTNPGYPYRSGSAASDALPWFSRHWRWWRCSGSRPVRKRMSLLPGRKIDGDETWVDPLVGLSGVLDVAPPGVPARLGLGGGLRRRLGLHRRPVRPGGLPRHRLDLLDARLSLGEGRLGERRFPLRRAPGRHRRRHHVPLLRLITRRRGTTAGLTSAPSAGDPKVGALAFRGFWTRTLRASAISGTMLDPVLDRVSGGPSASGGKPKWFKALLPDSPAWPEHRAACA